MQLSIFTQAEVHQLVSFAVIHIVPETNALAYFSIYRYMQTHLLNQKLRIYLFVMLISFWNQNLSFVK
jgi:hypothetical protein